MPKSCLAAAVSSDQLVFNTSDDERRSEDGLRVGCQIDLLRLAAVCWASSPIADVSPAAKMFRSSLSISRSRANAYHHTTFSMSSLRYTGFDVAMCATGSDKGDPRLLENHRSCTSHQQALLSHQSTTPRTTSAAGHWQYSSISASSATARSSSGLHEAYSCYGQSWGVPIRGSS